MDIKIRKANPQDEQVIREISEAAWLVAYSHIFGRDEILKKFEARKADTEYQAQQIDEFLHTNKHFVAEQNGTVVGFVSVSDEAEYFEITRLYVNPNFHRNGVGKKLFEYALQIGRRKNFKTMIVEALKENHIGCGFYTKQGGKIIKTWSKEVCGTTAEMVAFEYDI